MTTHVGDIIFGGPQLIRSLELGISSPTFLLVFVQILELAPSVKSLLESSSSNLCL